MSIDQQQAAPSSPPSISGVPVAGSGAHPLLQAAERLGDQRDGRSRLKAKDLVGLLLCHGARAWRSSQPVAHTRLKTFGPAGKPAVRLRFR